VIPAQQRDEKLEALLKRGEKAPVVGRMLYHYKVLNRSTRLERRQQRVHVQGVIPGEGGYEEKGGGGEKRMVGEKGHNISKLFKEPRRWEVP